MSDSIPPVLLLPAPIPEPPAPEPKAPVWPKVWAWIRKYIVAPIPILLIVIGAVILIALGFKNVNMGGLIGKVLGRKTEGEKTIEGANTVTPDRVQENGLPIPVGAPDSKGITQAQVVAIDTPGIFGDSSKIKVTAPGDTEATEVELPDGVDADTVETVNVVSPKIEKAAVESTSAVGAAKVKDLVKKYNR